MIRVVWNQPELIERLAALPVAPPLPERLAIASSARAAQALRRACVRSGRAGLGAGTRFLLAADLALELLHGEGIEVEGGEERRRPIRIRRLIEEGIELEHYPLDLLREAPGWSALSATSTIVWSCRPRGWAKNAACASPPPP